MPAVILKLNGREFSSDKAVITLGRTPDNDLSFSGDSNVSRFHAEIEAIDGDFTLIDLGSSNGTTLNGRPVESSARIGNGDQIVLGGSSEIAVEILPVNAEQPAEKTNAQASSADLSAATPPAFGVPTSAASAAVIDSPAVSSSFTPLLIAGAVCGLVILLVVGGAAAYYFMGGSGCDASAKIISPEPGETIIEAADIQVEVKNSACVGRAVYTIDGIEFAVKDSPPFDASIDPKDFPELADGFDHSLSVILEDLSGEPIGQAAPILLAFETREIDKPQTVAASANSDTQHKPEMQKAPPVSLIDVHEMSKRLVKQFSGNFAYNVSNKEFLQEVQKRTSEYAQEGYFQRAVKYRDAINVAYAREQNLDAALGFMLAMSRSKFIPGDQAPGQGLWRMSNEFVTANAYNGLCGTEALSDASQNCAAKASALYMKAVVFGVFDGDMIYSAAVFGKSPQEAGTWKTSLPANRSDIWNSIRTPQEREQLVRFFAAGIVAENPQKFGLKNDRPLSELYRLTM